MMMIIIIIIFSRYCTVWVWPRCEFVGTPTPGKVVTSCSFTPECSSSTNCQNFCFYRGAHASRWSVNSGQLTSSTWLLLNILISMAAVRVYLGFLHYQSGATCEMAPAANAGLATDLLWICGKTQRYFVFASHDTLLRTKNGADKRTHLKLS